MSGFIFIFYSLLSLSSLIHEHHVSITTIMLNEKSNKIEVSIQLTAHDIEYYFEKNKNLFLKLGSTKESPIADKQLEAYVNEHMILSVNKKNVSLNYLGKEVNNDESLWIYLESNLPDQLDQLSIKNSLLCQPFENQQNIVHVEGIIKESHTFNSNFQLKTFNR